MLGYNAPFQISDGIATSPSIYYDLQWVDICTLRLTQLVTYNFVKERMNRIWELVKDMLHDTFFYQDKENFTPNHLQYQRL